MPGKKTFDDLNFPRVIDTANTDFVTEFYEPLLKRAESYYRGVGFFSSSWIKSAARGVAEMAERGGKARWLTSPKLEEGDWEALQKGREAQTDSILLRTLQEQITDLEHDLEYNTRNTLAWMIADGLLELRFAIPRDGLQGIFHDKFGIFVDSVGNGVAFHGSQNDSKTALLNYEAYTVDCSWLSDRDEEGVENQLARFNRMWKGEIPALEVISIPDAAKQQIIELRDQDNRPYSDPALENSEITLRNYQIEAIDAWRANDRRGLFKMATGTGKTFTALAAVEAAFESGEPPNLVVIAVPFTHLAPQWAEEMELFDIPSPRYAYGTDNPNWKSDLAKAISNLNLGVIQREIIITTHQTLSNSYFIEQMRNHGGVSMLIGDEAHHLGSDYQQQGLLRDYDYRIGLTATPERYFDEAGTDFLLQFFGGIVYEFTLKEAIPEFLTPYDYHPVIVELTEEELEEYRTLSARLAKLAHSEDIDEEIWQRVADKRAKIVKSAENKFTKLRDVLNDIPDIDHMLVYTNSNQIDEVQEIVNREGLIQHKFTYRENSAERAKILDGFEKGEYDALIAMKCLDEGVDVPATKQAILMSNTGNPMQFIQRRGRVLRRFPNKEKSIIYDFVVVPSKHPDASLISSDRTILEKELRRFEEFAETADNERQANIKLRSLRIRYEIPEVETDPSEDTE
jgi:superfamily II DNA or RNA helicase